MSPEENFRSRSITQEQYAAINRRLQLGRQLQQDIPEIANSYRDMMSQTEICRFYDISSKYDVTEEMALDAVRFALMGHEGGFGVESYTPLLNESELTDLRYLHRQRAGKNKGEVVYAQRLGIHSLSREERVKNGKLSGKRVYELGVGIYGMTKEQRAEAGKRGAETNRRNGTGVFGMSFEERSNAGRKGVETIRRNGIGIFGMSSDELSKAGRRSAISQGMTLWEPEEVVFAYALSQLSQYQTSQGLPRVGLIAEKINEIFHRGMRIRSKTTVSRKIKEFKTGAN